MPALTEIRSVRFSLEDKRWLEERAASEDRSEGWVVRKLVKEARLRDLETTSEQKEGNED